MSSLQCLKRVHLEVNQPELAEISPKTQAAFDIGHAVGDIAVEVYGQGEGVYFEYGDGLDKAEAQTRELMDRAVRAPLFEATLEHGGVLVREDVLLPAGDSWRIVEVKASTKKKAEHVQDCAIQAWVHRGAGYPLERIALAHIDNQWVYPGDGDFTGILMAAKGKSDLAISVVKNSVAQIAAFLFPALVLTSLLFTTHLTFQLAPVYIGALFLTAIAVWQITGDGEAQVFEGVALIAIYAVLAAFTIYD